jgi:glycosyltransferase involved in cell wall biosynthesis
MARALIAALRKSGQAVELASRLRSFDRAGDPVRQRRIEALGGQLARRLVQRYRRRPPSGWPRAWLTYHAYHKSPDWLGPAMSQGLGIPYLIVEASFAPKQAGGPWAHGHATSERAIRAADVVLSLTRVDAEGLRPLIVPPAELRLLPPFLDPAPFQAAASERARHRAALAERLGLDPAVPWLLVVAMMRADVKRESYLLLAEALARLTDRPWRLIALGEGPARPEIEAALRTLGPERVVFGGVVTDDDLAAWYAATDLFVWPALREAYGLAMLEAQASGLPVVAGRDGGVTEVVRDGVTGILCPPRDAQAFAAAVVALLDDPARRAAMAARAQAFVAAERSLDRAARTLAGALADAEAIREARR